MHHGNLRQEAASRGHAFFSNILISSVVSYMAKTQPTYLQPIPIASHLSFRHDHQNHPISEAREQKNPRKHARPYTDQATTGTLDCCQLSNGSVLAQGMQRTQLPHGMATNNCTTMRHHLQLKTEHLYLNGERAPHTMMERS